MRHGFTLVETLIAMVLGAFIVALVSHAFLVQNEFYVTQRLRANTQDNVRASTELMAREIRNVVEDGVVIAGPRTLTVRSPMVMGVVCNRVNAADADVMTDGGEATLETSGVAGIARRNGTSWDYQPSAFGWSSINGSDTQSAANCAANGADTVGATASYHRLTGLNSLFSGGLNEGDVIMLFRQTSFTIRDSQLDPTTLGLFRADYGDPPVEFATGFDTTARFQYRTAPASYVDTVTTTLSDVDVVRIVADARERAATGGANEITFGWSVRVPLRNIR